MRTKQCVYKFYSVREYYYFKLLFKILSSTIKDTPNFSLLLNIMKTKYLTNLCKGDIY